LNDNEFIAEIRCRLHNHFLNILRTYIFEPSNLKTRIDELYETLHRKPIRLPQIRTNRQQRTLRIVWMDFSVHWKTNKNWLFFFC